MSDRKYKVAQNELNDENDGYVDPVVAVPDSTMNIKRCMSAFAYYSRYSCFQFGNADCCLSLFLYYFRSILLYKRNNRDKDLQP
jgi:hypothetical protein